MKALTDKIIEKQKALIDEIGDPHSEFGKGMQQVINNIKWEESQAEFEEIARVMMKHLGSRTDLYHPHYTVIITSTTAELVEGQKTVGKTLEYVPD